MNREKLPINDNKSNNFEFKSNKQMIEEMAMDICKSRICVSRGVADVNKCRKCLFRKQCLYQEIACTLFRAGYRKQSEVIRCKDCAYRDTEGCPLTYWNGGELVSNVEDDDFCSGAKMKGGEKE